MKTAPINFRKVDLDRDYETLCRWWDGHKTLHVPRVILPRGWIAEGGGIEIAASFLYLDPERIAVIEWTTTNPQCAMSADLLAAVKGLYAHLEAAAVEAKCLAVLSFVRPGSGEQRIMMKMGYCTSWPEADPGHITYAKKLEAAPTKES